MAQQSVRAWAILLMHVGGEISAFGAVGEVEFLRLLQVGHPGGNISLLQVDMPDPLQHPER